MSIIRLGLVGIGKIARDQHVPAILQDPRYLLVATASPSQSIPGVPAYSSVADMLIAETLDALSICTPPQYRSEVVATAIAAGMAVMLEKPPAASIGEVDQYALMAKEAKLPIFATWHSREAGAVIAIKDHLLDCNLNSVRVQWLEDVRHWHPGQDWIFAPGGFGVFDAGINALAILTSIIAEPFTVSQSTLVIANGDSAPIAANLIVNAAGIEVRAEFEFRHSGPDVRRIEFKTDKGPFIIDAGGSLLTTASGLVTQYEDREYAGLYRRFAEMIDRGSTDIDIAPLRLVADALLKAQWQQIDKRVP